MFSVNPAVNWFTSRSAFIAYIYIYILSDCLSLQMWETCIWELIDLMEPYLQEPLTAKLSQFQFLMQFMETFQLLLSLMSRMMSMSIPVKMTILGFQEWEVAKIFIVKGDTRNLQRKRILLTVFWKWKCCCDKPSGIFTGCYTIVKISNTLYHQSVNCHFFSQPMDVILSPPPDLVVSSLEAEDTYTTGSTLRVVFTVRNDGAGEPFERYWNDELVSEISFY